MLEVNETYLDRLSEAVYSLLNGRRPLRSSCRRIIRRTNSGSSPVM